VDERSHVAVHAFLRDHQDHFAVDDSAWMVIHPGRKARVLIVGSPNKILDAFFDDKTTGEVVTVDRLKREQLGGDAYQKAAHAGKYDLVIFDRCGPAKAEQVPQANTFFIGYPPPPWKPLGS